MSPIRKSEQARYPKDWKAIGGRILARAGDACEWPGCQAPNHQLIFRLKRDAERWRSPNGNDCGETDPDYYGVMVVLTVAHLNHQPEDCREENLRAWCQLHHLRYDKGHHQRNAATTRRLSKRNGELFSEQVPA